MMKMKEQFTKMVCPFPIEFFIGHRPADSKEYMNDRDSSIPELDGTLCCMRSYTSLMEKYKSREDYDYLITFEDDVLLHVYFFKKIHDVIAKFEKYPENEYVLLGYLLDFDINGINNFYLNDGGFYHTIWKHPHIWGTQSMLFKRITVEKIANALHKSTSREVRIVLNNLIDTKMDYAFKKARVQADAAIPMLCKYSFVYPPLAIESSTEISTIAGSKNNQTVNLCKHPAINPEKYSAEGAVRAL